MVRFPLPGCHRPVSRRVQFDDNDIYIANYIVDDWPRGQIRGYALQPEELLVTA